MAHETFETEVLPHLERVRRFAFRLTRDRATAEDLAQQAMLRALEAFNRYRQGGTARAWLFTIVLNDVRNLRRSFDRAARLALESVPLASLVTVEVPDATEVQAAIEKLPSGLREVMRLRERERLSYQQIAERLQLPIGTVMSRLHRARAKVRAQLS